MRVIEGDCLDVMMSMVMDGEQVDSVVTDPPYHLTPGKSGKGGFMGQAWDGGDIAFRKETWELAYALLKPGGYLLAFSGTRTYHRMACAIEDAGFEMRDMIAWVYGQGFAKGHNLKNRPELFCDCGDGGYALPYAHGTETLSEYDVRLVPSADISAPLDDVAAAREILFPGVPEQAPPARGASGHERQNVGGGQPGMEGREIRGTGQGLRSTAAPGPPTSEGQRVRTGALASDGEDDRTAAGGRGRGTPPGRGQAKQRPRESSTILGSPDALDGAPLRHGGCCPRCGKLIEGFKGFSTALKPALEPIAMARKPLIGTVAQNVAAHGTGAINIDGCRVPTDKPRPYFAVGTRAGGGNTYEGCTRGAMDFKSGVQVGDTNMGRWPANLIHDGSDEVLAAFPDAPGQLADASTSSARRKSQNVYGAMTAGNGRDGEATASRRYTEAGSTNFAALPVARRADTGSAARFFYCAKTPKSERGGSKHPTVKPLALMRYLCRLVTPPGGIVLDPFAGSGSTLEAAVLEGFIPIGIEQSPEFCADINARLIRASI